MNSFDYEYRVRYGDTDKLGVSYYANYFVWFEAARTEYFRALGWPYTKCEAAGFFLPAVQTGAEYHKPSTYDDLLIIRTSVSQLRRTSIRFEYQVFQKQNDELIATGFSLHVFVDRQMKPVRIPDEVRRMVTVYSLLENKKD